MQKDYAEQFSKEIIEVRDFTLIIEKLPQSFDQYKDSLSLKHAIWDQIQTKVKLCKEQGLCDVKIDSSIVDINLQTSDMDICEKQKDLKKTLKQIELNYIDILNKKESKERFQRNIVIGEAKAKIMLQVNALRHQLDILKVGYSEELGIEKVELSPEEMEEIDELKVRSKAKQFFESIVKIHVTFVSMEAKNLVESLFWQPKVSKQCFRLSWLCGKSQKLQLKS